MSKKIPYEEGDLFAVPLSGGYAIGVIARCPPVGRILYGYFFGPRRSGVPRVGDAHGLRPQDAVAVKPFGDLKLLNNAWPVIGKIEPWRRADWPMRCFVRTDSISGSKYKVEYADDGSNREIKVSPCTQIEAECLTRDGIAGAGAVESILEGSLPPASETQVLQ
jgi:hypothetical protein